jgi:GNAT superfamily N-acetyltransferase
MDTEVGWIQGQGVDLTAVRVHGDEIMFTEDLGPMACVYPYCGELVVEHAGGEGEDVIGRFEAYYVDLLRARINNFALEEVFERYDRGQLVSVFDGLSDPSTVDLCDSIERMLGGSIEAGNALVIERIELLPAYRGQGHAKRLAQCLMRRYGAGVSFYALHPRASQEDSLAQIPDEAWRDRLELHQYSFDQKIHASDKIGEKAQGLGFVKLPQRASMSVMVAPGPMLGARLAHDVADDNQATPMDPFHDTGQSPDTGNLFF